MTASSASSASSEGSAHGGLGQDRGHAVEAAQLLLLPGLTVLGVGLDPGALLADQEGDHLEAGARARTDASALGLGLHLTDGFGEHRDDAVVAALLARSGPGATGTGVGLVVPRSLLAAMPRTER